MNTFNLRLDLDKSTVVQVVTIRQGAILACNHPLTISQM